VNGKQYQQQQAKIKKTMRATKADRNRDVLALIALLEDNEPKPTPLCGSHNCGYRVGWAKQVKAWEKERFETSKHDAGLRLDRIALHDRSVPAFARFLISMKLGADDGVYKTSEQVGEAVGLSREQVRHIIDSAREIVATKSDEAKRLQKQCDSLDANIKRVTEIAANVVIDAAFYDAAVAANSKTEEGS
jgi:hypothetical protein